MTERGERNCTEHVKRTTDSVFVKIEKEERIGSIIMKVEEKGYKLKVKCYLFHG